MRVFYVHLKVGQREFIGEGPTRQDARHDAAKKALHILRKLPVPNDGEKKIESPTEVDGTSSMTSSLKIQDKELLNSKLWTIKLKT